MCKFLLIALGLIQSLLVFCQQEGVIIAGVGGGKFQDHHINGYGISAAIKSPYILKKQKVFIQVGASLFVGEGNRNFTFDPESRNSISTTNHPDFFNTLRENPDIWKSLDVKTSQSRFTSYELLAGKTFELGKQRHFISLSGGVYRATISQYYILESINVHMFDSENGPGGELLYHIPFSQQYKLYNFVANLNYLYKLSDRFFLSADCKYFHQAKPLSGNFFFTLGVAASL